MLGGALNQLRKRIPASIAATALVAMLFLLWAATESPSYQQCQSDRATAYSYYDENGGLDAAETFFVCEGIAIGQNGEFITAMATVALVFSTILLWAATRDAAKIAERSLRDLERPWLLVTAVAHAAPFDDANQRVEFQVTNCGKQAGIIEGIRGGSKADRAVDIESIPMKEASNKEVGDTVRPDEPATLTIPFKIGFTPEDIEHLKKGEAEFIIRGAVLYRGLTNQKCETGFCWRYDRERDRLVRHGGEKHNYAK